MPQHSQHPLVHVLLLWITIISVVQVVFIAYFFAAGHHGPSQNSSAVTPQRTKQIQAYSTPLPSSDLLGKGKMLTFQCVAADGRTWKSRNSELEIISEEDGGKALRVETDGYFFVSLQVTMASCPSLHKVSLKGGGRVILQGWINNNTCSSGFLGKVEDLSAGSRLEVTIDGEHAAQNVDEDISVTHLDIIYLFKPAR